MVNQRRQPVQIAPEEIAQTEQAMQQVRAWNQEHLQAGRTPRAHVMTYGCQQNEADSQRLAGMAQRMGYERTENAGEADWILVNTCAVREHAEMRALGNIGQLSHYKKANPHLIIAVCGCMVQQEHMTEKLRRSYPYVDLVFGTHALWRFPQLLYQRLTQDKRVFDIADEPGRIAEDLPVARPGGVQAWLSIMYGCNNYCSYCIVPYVRGRERSREPGRIEEEFRALLADGYREITLLGQNVNSYGKDLPQPVSFAQLLERLNAIPGEFWIRFMTSHPKDMTPALIDTIARCPKVARKLHLPFQSGSDTVLQRMNRGYTAGHYLSLIDYARDRMPELEFSSDVIVGFPNETAEEFSKTMDLVRRVRFQSLFTFLYSPRSGTPAAAMEDATPTEEKKQRFSQLLACQNEITRQVNQTYLSRRLRVLIDGETGDAAYPYSARTQGGILVLIESEKPLSLGFCDVVIVRTTMRSLIARVLEEKNEVKHG